MTRKLSKLTMVSEYYSLNRGMPRRKTTVAFETFNREMRHLLQRMHRYNTQPAAQSTIPPLLAPKLLYLPKVRQMTGGLLHVSEIISPVTAYSHDNDSIRSRLGSRGSKGSLALATSNTDKIWSHASRCAHGALVPVGNFSFSTYQRKLQGLFWNTLATISQLCRSWKEYIARWTTCLDGLHDSTGKWTIHAKQD